jgi:hypothetical protein
VVTIAIIAIVLLVALMAGLLERAAGHIAAFWFGVAVLCRALREYGYLAWNHARVEYRTARVVVIQEIER